MKKKLILSLVGVLAVLACAPKEIVTMHSFELIPIDLEKLEQKDYSELATIVDNKYGGGKDIFKDVTPLEEEGQYIVVRVNSSVDESCYRISVDRNRSKVTNIRPDCEITIEKK